MEEYDGRINDSCQPVTSMTIPFASLRGGWVQDADMKFHRLIVPSGHEQLIRSVYRPWRCAGRDEVLKEARWCAESIGSSDAEAEEILDVVTAFENRRIKLGGREEFENHNKLLRYMITHKMVERAGCVVCPSCLKETPAKMSMCLMMSHGRRKIEIKIEDDSGDENEMEVDESTEVEQETTEQQKEDYKDAVDEGMQAADNADAYGFSEDEVDYGAGEDDVEMESKDEMEEGEPTDEKPETQDDNVKKRADYEALLKKFPKWTHPLEFGVKSMPITNLMNVDPDEGAARIFDNLVLIYILGFMDQ